jgi:hypothetical protein
MRTVMPPSSRTTKTKGGTHIVFGGARDNNVVYLPRSLVGCECCSGRRLLGPQFRQLTWALWGALESARETTWSPAVVRDQSPVDVDTHPLEKAGERERARAREKGLGEYRSHQSEEPLDE